MLIDRRDFFLNLAAFATVFSGASFSMSKDNSALAYLQDMAETIMREENVGCATIHATSCALLGEVDTYDEALMTNRSAVRLSVAVLDLEKTRIGRDDVNAALFRLKHEMEVRHLMNV